VSGPLPGLFLPVTAPLSWAYERVIRLRNARYDRGDGVNALDVPVMSVGNITAGGTGKTPMVTWIARQLLAAGHQPAIAMRGYGASHDMRSDEAIEYQHLLPDVPVVADPDRTRAVRSFLASNDTIDSVILDDGFQHRRLHRDVDLVLIDATRGTFSDRLLPAGYLREPLDALARADAVIITRTPGVDTTLASQVERYHGRPPIAWSRHWWRELTVHDPAEASSRTEPVDWLEGRRVLTMLGVGNPESIIDHIEAVGARVSANVPARDHEAFTSAKLRVARGLCDGVHAMLVTAKDWVKLREMPEISEWPVPIIVPMLEIDVFDGAAALTELLKQRAGAGCNRLQQLTRRATHTGQASSRASRSE